MLDLSTLATFTTTAFGAITWDVDPVIFSLGPLTFRYYGLLFAGCLLIGHQILIQQFRKANDDPDAAVTLTYWLVLAVLLGSRFAHVFFYDWHRYSQDIEEIFYIWKGGLSSHGGFIGLMLAIGIYARYRNVPYFVMADRLAVTVPPAMFMVRLGNLMNSEIYGRPTDVAWAFVFKRVDDIPRHPTQIYEMFNGILMLLLIFGVERYYDRKKEERPLGLMTSLLLAIYFTVRFFLEFFKEFQGGSDVPGALTMGQMLSIPFAVAAYIGIAVSLYGPWKKVRASHYAGSRPPGVPSPFAKTAAPAAPNAPAEKAQ